MVVDNLDILGASFCPAEANPKLIVDPNAMLPFAVSLKSFQPISGRTCEITKRLRRIKHVELSQRQLRNSAPGPRRHTIGVESRNRVIPIRPNCHYYNVARYMSNSISFRVHQGNEDVFERGLLGVEVFVVDAKFADALQEAVDAGVACIGVKAVDELTAFVGEFDVIAV